MKNTPERTSVSRKDASASSDNAPVSDATEAINPFPPLRPTPLNALRASTIDLARRLDPLLARLEDTQGAADLRIEIRKGQIVFLHVSQNYKFP